MYNKAIFIVRGVRLCRGLIVKVCTSNILLRFLYVTGKLRDLGLFFIMTGITGTVSGGTTLVYQAKNNTSINVCVVVYTCVR